MTGAKGERCAADKDLVYYFHAVMNIFDMLTDNTNSLWYGLTLLRGRVLLIQPLSLRELSSTASQ